MWIVTPRVQVALVDLTALLESLLLSSHGGAWSHCSGDTMGSSCPTNNQQPTNNQPTTNQPPTTNRSTIDNRQSTVNSQQSTVNSQQPTANSQQPTTNNNHNHNNHNNHNNNNNNNSEAILAQVVDIRRRFLRLGVLSGAILSKRSRFGSCVLRDCVPDTEWRSRLFPCRNSMSPSLEPSLELGPAAASLAAACPRRRLRSVFSRFCLRCALGGPVALLLVGSVRFPCLCRLRSSSCSPRRWSLAVLHWCYRRLL